MINNLTIIETTITDTFVDGKRSSDDITITNTQNTIQITWNVQKIQELSIWKSSFSKLLTNKVIIQYW